ncbi:MAG TPA: LUD domain-containing protein, partial [Methylomirabilota bacterium]|nr:LUD domain-containing protein [Methylomirabilota bacterium]
MAASPKGDFFESSRAAVNDHELRRKLESASARHLDHFAQVKAEFPTYDDERDAAHRIKTDAIAHLDELLIELTTNLEQRGCKVFFAEDAADARDYIVKLAKSKRAKNVVKGKSMTTEEIELNHALAGAGIDAIETDLGEYIVQLRGEGPSHIITPAIHLSKEDIGQLFTEKFGIEYTAEPEKLTAEARDRLRAIFLSADFGVTGVNFAI